MKRYETMLKLGGLLITLSGAWFGLKYTTDANTKAVNNLTVKLDKMTEKLEQISIDMAVLKARADVVGHTFSKNYE